MLKMFAFGTEYKPWVEHEIGTTAVVLTIKEYILVYRMQIYFHRTPFLQNKL